MICNYKKKLVTFTQDILDKFADLQIHLKTIKIVQRKQEIVKVILIVFL